MHHRRSRLHVCALSDATQCASTLASSVHYVGYVEDDETPEAIMKKFEALERVQKLAEAQKQATQAGDGDHARAENVPAPVEAAASGDQVLTEEQLLEVFKQTSAFSVKTVQTNGASAARRAALVWPTLAP